jgi:hypothetical protein
MESGIICTSEILVLANLGIITKRVLIRPVLGRRSNFHLNLL